MNSYPAYALAITVKVHLGAEGGTELVFEVYFSP
jgi:hypothetical protein